MIKTRKGLVTNRTAPTIDADTVDGSHAADFAAAGTGVTNGNSHDHSGGDGAQIDHAGLSNIGMNTHAQVDSHIASTSNPHSVTAAQAGAAPSANGVTNGDSHDHSGGDGAQINHTTLSNIGTNTHAQVDTHIAAASPHSAHATLSGGKVPTTELGGAGADATKFLRGDQSWQVPGGGGNHAATHSDGAADPVTLSNLVGPLSIAKGGTGQTVKTAAFNALSPLSTKGDLLIHNGVDNLRIAIGNNYDIPRAHSAYGGGMAWYPGAFVAVDSGTYPTIRHITTTNAFSITLDGDLDYYYRMRFFGSATPSAGSGRLGWQFNADAGANYRNSWHKNTNGVHDIGVETLNGMNCVWMGSQNQWDFDATFQINAKGGQRAALCGVISVGRENADDIVSEISGQMWKSTATILAVANWFTSISTIDAWLTLERFWQ